MKTKSIKKYAITAAVIVAVCAVFALLFFGMSRLLHIDKGQVVAEYNGVMVYESDVQDIINYHLIVQTTENMTEAGLQTIMTNAVETYVNYLVMEIDLAEKGYKIDEEAFKKTLKETKAEIDETYGYKEWCDMYRVSKDFLEEELRRYEIAALYYEYAETSIEVTEAEAKDYYNKHALTEYTLPAGYYWTSLLRPVLDYTDEAELASAKAEMEAYIEKINNGTMTFDEVAAELKATYTSDKGYLNAQFAGEDFTSMSDMVEIRDEEGLNQLYAEFDEHYKDRDLSADKNSEAYANYMNYVASVFKANVFYALQHLELGEIYDKPLESFAGYYIVRLDSIESTNEFKPFEDVEDEIVAKLYSEKMEDSMVDYCSDLKDEFGIVFYI